MKVIKIINEDFDPDFDSNDYEDIKQEDVDFGEDIFNLIQDLIDSENSLYEEFTSQKALEDHYDRHCLGSYTDRISDHNTVYYDFTNINQYKDYENIISKKVQDTHNIITSLEVPEVISKAFYNLFKGNTSLYFTTSCGFSNKRGPVSIGLNSFASKYTKNYNANTINFLIFGGGKTITMYPIDSYYLQTKLNNILKKNSLLDTEFKYNN